MCNYIIKCLKWDGFDSTTTGRLNHLNGTDKRRIKIWCNVHVTSKCVLTIFNMCVPILPLLVVLSASRNRALIYARQSESLLSFQSRRSLTSQSKMVLLSRSSRTYLLRFIQQFRSAKILFSSVAFPENKVRKAPLVADGGVSSLSALLRWKRCWFVF